MSDEETHTPVDVEKEDEPNYQPPPEKSIDDMLQQDQEDESLQKYKATLLGGAVAGTGAVVVDESDPRKVIVKAISLVVESEERPESTLDLTQDPKTIKSQSFTLKEGVKFRFKIDFIVQREIVHGLKFVQKTYTKGIPVDKMTHMVGSYAPKQTAHSWLSPPEDAPSGMLSRGTFSLHSLFTDDDKNEHLKWEWNLNIKKNWDNWKKATSIKSDTKTKKCRQRSHISHRCGTADPKMLGFASFLWLPVWLVGEFVIAIIVMIILALHHWHL